MPEINAITPVTHRNLREAPRGLSSQVATFASTSGGFLNVQLMAGGTSLNRSARVPSIFRHFTPTASAQKTSSVAKRKAEDEDDFALRLSSSIAEQSSPMKRRRLKGDEGILGKISTTLAVTPKKLSSAIGKFVDVFASKRKTVDSDEESCDYETDLSVLDDLSRDLNALNTITPFCLHHRNLVITLITVELSKRKYSKCSSDVITKHKEFFDGAERIIKDADALGAKTNRILWETVQRLYETKKPNVEMCDWIISHTCTVDPDVSKIIAEKSLHILRKRLSHLLIGVCSVYCLYLLICFSESYSRIIRILRPLNACQDTFAQLHCQST